MLTIDPEKFMIAVLVAVLAGMAVVHAVHGGF